MLENETVYTVKVITEKERADKELITYKVENDTDRYIRKQENMKTYKIVYDTDKINEDVKSSIKGE